MDIIKPGLFGKAVSADSQREIFDKKNEQILSENAQVDFTFIGDSITHMWQLEVFFKDLGLVVNRGICGDTTEYILKRSDGDVFQYKPKNVVYLAGINDLLTTAPNLWYRTNGADKKSVLANIKSNIERFMEKCELNKINGYFCSILPTDFCVPYNSFGLEDMIIQVNQDIKALCQKHNMIYVDYFSALCTPDKKHILDGLTNDGVHPNAKTYKIMSEILKNQIKVKK